MKNREHELQSAFFDWVFVYANRHPELFLMFAIPNGGLRDKRVARRLKAEGVKAGVPDVFLACARGGYHGLFAEFKVPPNTLTNSQARFLASASKEGFFVDVWTSWDIATRTTLDYLDGKIRRKCMPRG